MKILRPVRPVSPLGPPMMNRPNRFSWKMVFLSRYCSGITNLITCSLRSATILSLVTARRTDEVEDCADTELNNGSMVVVVLNGDLGQPWARSILADLSQVTTKPSDKHIVEGHELGGLISGITKHVTLVPSTILFWSLGVVAMET